MKFNDLLPEQRIDRLLKLVGSQMIEIEDLNKFIEAQEFGHRTIYTAQAELRKILDISYESSIQDEVANLKSKYDNLTTLVRKIAILNDINPDEDFDYDSLYLELERLHRVGVDNFTKYRELNESIDEKVLEYKYDRDQMLDLLGCTHVDSALATIRDLQSLKVEAPIPVG